MTTLSIDQVATLALTKLSAQAAVTATAIAMRESGGVLEVHNPVPPDDSYGLWQINRLAHPQYSPALLMTAQGNYQAMLDLSGGGANWMPWQIGGNPLARTNPAAAAAAVSRVSGNPVALPDGSTPNVGSSDVTGLSAQFSSMLGVAEVGDMVGKAAAAASWVANPANWLRLAEGVLGALGMILGSIMVAKSLRHGS